MIQYLNVEYTFLVGGYCDCNKDVDVLYVSLDNWIKDSESGCTDAHIRLVHLDVGYEEGVCDGIKPQDQAGWSQRRKLYSQYGRWLLF